MPNKKNIKKWVQALRSGKYKQTKGSLKVADRHCCLGVASEVYVQETGKGGWSRSSGCRGAAYIFESTAGNASIILPHVVMKWLGLDSHDPTLKLEDGEEVDASELNDGDLTQEEDRFIRKPYTFDQIADAIERTYLKGG